MHLSLDFEQSKLNLSRLQVGNMLFQSYNPGENVVCSAAFIKSGMQEGHRCIYISNGYNKETLLTSLRQKGWETSNSNLQLKLIDLSQKSPEADYVQILNRIHEEIEIGQQSGFINFTIVIDHILKGNIPDSELLIQIACISWKLVHHKHCILLMQFNRQYYSYNILQMLRPYFTHIFDNQIYDNPMYEKVTAADNSMQPIINENTFKKMNINHLPAFKTNTEGKILACNTAFLGITGYSKEELTNIPAENIAAGKKCIFSTVANNNQSVFSIYHFNSLYVKKDGTFLKADEVMVSFLEGENTICYYLLDMEIDQDTNDSHRMLSASSQTLQNLFQTCSSTFAVFNRISDIDWYPDDTRFLEIYHNHQITYNPGNIFSQLNIRELLLSNWSSWHNLIKTKIREGQQANFMFYDQRSGSSYDVILFSPGAEKAVVLFFDITQMKKLDKAFQERVFFLQNIINGIPTPAFYRDTSGRFQFCNKAFEIALGLSSKEIIGRSLFKVLPEDLAEKYRKMDLDLLTNAGIQTYEWEFQHSDGKRHDVIFNKAPLSNSEGDFIGVVGTFIDITQGKKAQEALRQSEEKFRSVFDQSPIGIAIYNPYGVLLDANFALRDILGITSIKDIYQLNFIFNQPCNDYNNSRQNYMDIFSYEDEFDFDLMRAKGILNTRKNGKAFIRYSINPLRSQDGTVEGYLVQIQDTTEQRLAQSALQASESNLRRLTDNMRDIICQINLNGNLEYLTPSCKSVLGYEPDEMLNQSFYDFVHPQDIKYVKGKFDKAFHSKSFIKLEYRYRCKDGTYLFMETVANMIYDQEGVVCGAVLVTRDITGRKQMEKELSRLDRLRTVGEMAAGLGHEIRNPMTTVRGFLQMLGNNHDLQKYNDIFDLMIEEIDHANSIITEYLSLAKDKPLYPEKENLNDILMAVSPLISADAIKSDKQVHMDLKSVPDLMLDSKEIRQLIFNLTRNGIEAMSSGGILTIKTYMEEEYVILHIEDQGCGIQDEILENLGTPFHTTKDQGIGLGLPICYNIATRHHATIEIRTSPKGSVFLVRFNPASL